MRSLATLLTICLFLSFTCFGQIVYYDETTGGTGTGTTVVNTSANLTVTTLMDVGFGTNTPCTSGGLSGKTVNTTYTSYASSNPHYYFKITPNPGYTLDITGWNEGTRRSTSGPITVVNAYSLDNGVTWVSDASGTPHTITATSCGSSTAMAWGGGTLPTGITSTNGIIIAVFPFSAGNSSGTFQTNYIKIYGTVNIGCTPPVVSATAGSASICIGTNTTLTGSGAGTGGTYTWAPSTGLSATSGATVSANPTATTTYTVTGTNASGCSDTGVVTVAVTPLPTVAVITGPSSVCAGGATITLANTTIGGTWSSLYTSMATVTASGMVTGVAAGVDTIKYAVTNSCGTTTVAYAVTVDPYPTVNNISGPNSVCTGANITLSNTTIGGTWSSLYTSMATVTASGMVTGVAAGVDTIKYAVTNGCGTTTVAYAVTVNPYPTVNNISGPTSVCTGANITLSNTTIGGTWSSVYPSMATVTSTGIATGVAAGVDTIKYAVTNGCGTTTVAYAVTVNPYPTVNNISGPTSVCTGANITLSNTAIGGTWSSVYPSMATVAASGMVTGVAAGVDTIKYAVTNGCGTTTVAYAVTVNPYPTVNNISGPTSVCAAATISLSNTTIGGTWSSLYPAIATITASGIVTGVGAGVDTIKYAVTNGCGTTTVVYAVTVNPLPVVAGITGPDSVCMGASISLGNTITGGSWSSMASSIATVSGNTVYGANVGSANIQYAVTTVCGTATTMHSVYVKALPNAGTLAGADSVCYGTSISLTSSAPGGIWSSALPAVATVSATGIVTGLSPVLTSTSIIYTVSTFSCGSATASHAVTVRPQPNAGSVTGAVLCSMAGTALSSSAPGGSWSSGLPTVATVNSSGAVTGLIAGTAVITYAVTNSCGTATDTALITVNPVPEPITGNTIICVGISSSLSSATPGGIWSTSNATIATVNATGYTTGMSIGSANISYTLPATGCYRSTPLSVGLSVTPTVSMAASSLEVCAGTPVTYLATSTWGGTSPIYVWSVNNVIIAGGTSYTYAPQDGDLVRVWFLSSLACAVPDTASTSVVMTVHHIATPSLDITTGMGDTVCAGVLTTFTPIPTDGGTIPSYQWTVNGIPSGAGPTFTYIPVNGDVVTTNMTSNAYCRTADHAIATRILTVSPFVTPDVTTSINPGPISCEGYPVTYTAAQTNGGTNPQYQWLVNGTPSGTGQVFTYPPANGDVVGVILTSNFPCVTTPTATENTAMTVIPVTQPVGIISVSPGYIINPGAYDTFTVNIVSGGGIAPTFQWFVNAIPVTGATNATYITNQLHTGDSVNCVVTNNDQCSGVSTFNYIYITVGNNVGVTNITGNTNHLDILPNPSSGMFIVRGTLGNTNDKVRISITDMPGRIVYTDEAMLNNGELNKAITTTGLTPGMYLLTVQNDKEIRTLRLVIR